MKVVDGLSVQAGLEAIPGHSIIPMPPSVLSLRERDPVETSIMTTALMWMDVFLKPGGIRISSGMSMHKSGTLVLWGVAPGSIYDRPVHA